MRQLAWPFFLVALAGCASSISTLPSAAGHSDTVPGSLAGASSDRARSGVVVIRVKVPKGSQHVLVRTIRDGRPAYVSASTKAARIVAQNGGKKTVVVVPLTPASPGCTTHAGVTSCTVRIFLPVCAAWGKCYTATVSTYDKVFCNGAPPVCSVPASASELSAGQSVPFRVATGKANTISLTLSGVPHSTTVSPDALTRLNGSAYDLVGPGAHAFTGQTYDVDGNAIVGPGSPSFTASAPTGGLAVTVTSPSSAPSQVWVTPPATLNTTQTATFQMTPSFAGQSIDGCKQKGAKCDAVGVTVDMAPMAAMLGFTGVLSLYALNEQNARVSLTGLAATAYGLQTDAAGDIFTANGLPTVYTPPLSAGTVLRPPCCPGGGGTTTAIGTATDGSATFLSYYSAQTGNQQVVSKCSATTCSPLVYILSYYANYANQALASDASGDIVYGNATQAPGTSYSCFATVYAAGNYRMPVTLSGSPMSLTDCAAFVATDPAGDVFVSDKDNNQIVEYSKSSGYKTATIVQTGANGTVVAMLVDSSGNLFDVVNVSQSFSSFPYVAFNLDLQETLASSLSDNQGGSLQPDLTGTYFNEQNDVLNAVATVGPGGVYVQTSGLPLLEFTLPSLSPVELTPNPQAQATGLLVLP